MNGQAFELYLDSADKAYPTVARATGCAHDWNLTVSYGATSAETALWKADPLTDSVRVVEGLQALGLLPQGQVLQAPLQFVAGKGWVRA